MSNSITQASCKRRSRNPIRRNISELPDAILHHILSFLPTKDAIATSILSTRWRFVWTSVPVLDFEDSRRCKTNENHRTAFTNLVSRALILNKMGSLDKFRLKCYSLYGPSWLNTWIGDAIQRDFVREIDISIYVTTEKFDFDFFKLDFFKLPSSFFIKNLKVLKLCHGILIDIPNNMPVCFPSLRILHLVFVDYSNNESVSSLLRGCPVLEEIFVKRHSDGDEAKIFNLSVPTLKTLSYISYPRALSWPELNIYAPMLEYLNLNIEDDDERYLVYLESAFNSIIKANVSFDETGLSQLARALCNAKFLSLKCINGMDFKAFTLPSFPNLTQIELRIGSLHWDVILHFLENTPNLEVLVLDYEEILTSARRETDERDCLPSHLSPCLRKVYIRGFRGYRHELEMVKYILKNSRALNLIEICSSATFLDSKFGMLQKLSEIPRHSETCQLKFK